MVSYSRSRGKKTARIIMRNKYSGSGSGTDTDPISSLINKKRKRSSGNKQKSSRKAKTRTRSKTRKPKYLSLRLQFSSEKSQEYYSEMPSSTVTTATTTTTTTTTSDSNQLNLFPLHPENLVEEKEAHDENMAYLFSAADGGATTLTGLLGSSTKPSFHQVDDKNNNSDSSTTTLSPSASLTYAYAGRQEEVALVRTALRNKEREPSEERWVRYSEVVERREDQEVSSCAAPAPAPAPDLRRRNQGLSLKLDYEEILTAWSDKGPLFLHAACAASSPQSPQTVPDIYDDFLFASQLPNRMIKDGWANNDGGGVWRVPEFTKGPDSVKVKIEEQQGAAEAVVVDGGDQWKVGQREASVKRYKEKRLNRLFSKRIRYQVRKLNAEKRPRIKGRFVKRS